MLRDDVDVALAHLGVARGEACGERVEELLARGLGVRELGVDVAVKKRALLLPQRLGVRNLVRRRLPHREHSPLVLNLLAGGGDPLLLGDARRVGRAQLLVEEARAGGGGRRRRLEDLGLLHQFKRNCNSRDEFKEQLSQRCHVRRLAGVNAL